MVSLKPVMQNAHGGLPLPRAKLMALLTTAFNVANGTMALKTTPYQGAGDLQKQSTGIPRAELNYTISNGVIALSGVGDSQRIVITCELPLSYAYVLQEVSLCNLTGVDGDNWPDRGFACIRNNLLNGTDWKSAVDIFSRGDFSDAVGGFGKSYICPSNNYVSRLIIPETSANFLMNLHNITTNQSAMTLGAFHCRFLQYDIAQAYTWPVNSPVLTR